MLTKPDLHEEEETIRHTMEDAKSAAIMAKLILENEALKAELRIAYGLLKDKEQKIVDLIKSTSHNRVTHYIQE